MNLPKFVALPGEHVTVCAQNKVSNGKVAFASGVQVIRELPSGQLRIYNDTRYQVEVDGVLIETHNLNTYIFSLEDVKGYYSGGILEFFSYSDLHEFARMIEYALKITPASQVCEFLLLNKILQEINDLQLGIRTHLQGHEPRRA